ncbi:alcohol dehydrogenase zinc-binding domain protein [Rhizoctonia solani]|uniref:Alcohol dehydrogenase zinc-binding domain protein n=1 Tax=Rhizoctonia solani TaxID=456999 RepID=A0A0K6FW32_9AGAM|nr:alcohol dehydrogenase zinc-binding domain protein [Rhizoctonia solani]
MASIPTVAQAWRLPVDRSSWNGHKSLQLREVKISPPKQGEVLVKLHAAALNFRDILISRETYVGPTERSTGPDGQGLILTCDGAGEVVALGEGVTQWKKGDCVHSLFYETWFDGPFESKYMYHTLGGTSPGCLSQYRVFTAESLLSIPPYLSYEEASTIPCAALTAWHALFEKRPTTDKLTVLVLGNGGVSVFGAQLAKAAGARVIAGTRTNVIIYLSFPTVAQAWRLPVDRSSWNTHKSLELREVKISPPKKGEVLVKVHAAALNYRDILISHEKYPGIQERTTGPDGQGLILTSDGAGEVIALGEGVTQWKTGDRVHSLFYETWFDGPYEPKYMQRALGASASGCLTQYRIFTTESLLPIPPHLSYEEASTIPCAALTAWHPFFEKQPVNNQSTVLVLGSGGVSVFGAQLCKAAGARVIATTSSQVKAERYRWLGVDEVINYREFPQWSVKVKELTEGHGVEQVLEVGGQGTLVQSVRSVKPNGYVHMIGAVAGNTPGGGLAELGGAIVSTPVSGHMVGSKAMCERLDKFITEHKIKPVIDRVFGWNEVIEAFDYQLGGGHFGKIVVKTD